MLGKNYFAVLLLFLVCLQGCQHNRQLKPGSVDHQYEMFDLSDQSNYIFTGKMSFSDGQDGGSGSVKWQNNRGLITTELKAPLGSKSWELKELMQGAESTSDGHTEFAESAQTLISNQLGWHVPWQHLKFWVIGKPYNVELAHLNWQNGGFLLSENGWRIEYSRLKEVTNQPVKYLSHKIVARKAEYSIKLIIKEWNW